MVKYKYTIKFWSLVARFVRSLIFNLISDGKLKLFVRTNDIISESPILEGTHEPQILDFFSCASNAGYSDFFVDIGGNVGLSSCLASDLFSFFHVYEINPLAFKILEVNMRSHFSSEKFLLNNFGIGDSERQTSLLVPKNNWGGAYINDDGNSYSDEVLAKKDGFSNIIKKNYDRSDVSIKKGSEEFTRVFHRELKKNGRPVKGVIKIDVEGYERTVIKELAGSNRENVSMLVVFENWDISLTYDDIQNEFGDKKIKLSKISRRAPFPAGAPKFVKLCLFVLLAPFGCARVQYGLDKVSPNDGGASLVGDLVLELDAA